MKDLINRSGEMLKLGTVFSGIGAIEHALQRMHIDYQIVFACDNGEIDIFNVKLNNNIAEIYKLLKKLSNEINALNFVVDDDYNYMKNLDEHIVKIKKKINFLEEIADEKIGRNTSLESIIKKYGVNTESNVLNLVHKNVLLYIENVENADNLKERNTSKLEIRNKTLDKLLVFGEVWNILKKGKLKNNNELQQIKPWFETYLKSSLYKKIKKETSLIVDEVKMLNEKIETLKIIAKLSKVEDYKEKKKIVDDLYKDKESSNFVKKSYLANYKINKKDFHWNISFLDANQYKGKLDLLVGGSPCQSFSLVGKRRGLEDTRGTLFYEFARIIKEAQPKIFIYENVRALLSHDNGNTWRIMQEVFSELNYSYSYKTLNAKDYGIPQNRERIFVVGFRNDLKLESHFEFPDPIPLKKNMKDFLIENTSGKYYLNEKGVDFVTSDKNLAKRYTQIDGDIQLCQKKNQQFNWHGDFVFEEENKSREKIIQDLEKYFLSKKVEKYVLSTGTKGFYSKPKIDLDVARPLVKTMHKMHRAGVDNYVTTEGRIRKLTPRECLRLMGFCDSFKIVVSDTQIYQQAGNSIVVDVLMHIMRKIIESYPDIV